VRENICYGLHYKVDDQTVIDILTEASLWDGDNGIKSKPDQLLTKLGSGGISLSGGQTQRVSIARAMIRNPDVILLDEATSALDNKNEKTVQRALDRLAERGSALVIAHRLTTIRDAGKIVVIRKGIKAEEGTHDELLAKSIVKKRNEKGDEDVADGIYRMLWELQFAKDANADDPPKIKTVLKELKKFEKDPQAYKVAAAAYDAASTASAWDKLSLLQDKCHASPSQQEHRCDQRSGLKCPVIDKSHHQPELRAIQTWHTSFC
jgi:ABC-type multidrug transport system ATPase subunit